MAFGADEKRWEKRGEKTGMYKGGESSDVFWGTVPALHKSQA
jgi:hypothetical protein